MKRKRATVADDGFLAFSESSTRQVEARRRMPPWRHHDFGYDLQIHPFVALHNEVLELCDLLTATSGERRTREGVIEELTNVAAAIWPTSQLWLFGSGFTGLSLPSSDLDVVINGATGDALSIFSNELQEKGIGCNMLVIRRAKVPIIKMTHAKSGIAVDISFNRDDGPRSSVLVRKALRAFPVARPLILTLKLILKQRSLNETFGGGVGSFLITLMTISFLQHRLGKRHPLGNASGAAAQRKERQKDRRRKGAEVNLQKSGASHASEGGNHETKRANGAGKNHDIEEELTDGTAGREPSQNRENGNRDREGDKAKPMASAGASSPGGTGDGVANEDQDVADNDQDDDDDDDDADEDDDAEDEDGDDDGEEDDDEDDDEVDENGHDGDDVDDDSNDDDSDDSDEGEEVDPNRCPWDANLGVLLICILDYYSKGFNFGYCGLSLLDGGTVYNKHQRAWFQPARPYLISVENPDNPSADVGKNTILIDEVRTAFGWCAKSLKRGVASRVADEDTLASRYSLLGLIIDDSDPYLAARGHLVRPLGANHMIFAATKYEDSEIGIEPS